MAAVRAGLCLALLLPALIAVTGQGASAQESATEAPPEAVQAPDPGVSAEPPAGAAGPVLEDGAAADSAARAGGSPSSQAQGRAGRLVSSGEGSAFGAALGLVNLPQESDFEGEVPSFDLFWTGYSSPWWNYQFGLNHTNARFEGFAMSTNAFYAAYLARGALGERFDVHASFGLAWHMATLQSPDGEAQAASGIGPLFGAGMRYAGDSLLIGLQFLMLAHTADFNSGTVATGSNQIQFTLEFPLD